MPTTLSALDTAFLDLEDGHCALHLGGVAVFEGPVPDRAAMAEVYERGIAGEPRYRRRLRRPFALAGPVWVEDRDFDPEYHLRRTALPAPGGRAEFERLIGRIMSARLDESRPPWEAWVVEGLTGGRWALILKLHHCLVDGLAAMSLFTDLLDPPEAGGPAPGRGPGDGRGSAGRTGSVRRFGHGVAAAALAPRHSLRSGARIVLGATGYLRDLYPVERTSLTGPLGAPRRYRIASVPRSDVTTIREAFGGTVNDVVLTLVSRGFRHLLTARGEHVGPRAVRALVPVTTRARSRRVDGNEVSALLVDLPVDYADPVVTHEAVVARTRLLKRTHEADAGWAGLVLAGVLPERIRSAGLRLFRRVPQRVLSTVVTNVPGPPGEVRLLGRRLLALYPYVPIAERIRIGVALTSYGPELSFGITCDRDSVGDADVFVSGLLDGLADLLDRARVSGGSER